MGSDFVHGAQSKVDIFKKLPYPAISSQMWMLVSIYGYVGLSYSGFFGDDPLFELQLADR